MLGSLHDALAANLPSPFIPPRVSNYGTPPQLLRWLATTERTLQRENSSSVLRQAFAACQEARDLLLTIDDWWQQAASSLPVQLLHGDYGGGNILFQGNTIVAVLDFDFLSIRERVFELAYTTYWLFQRLEPNIFPDASSWQKAADLLAIYNQSTMHPLTEQEWAAFAFEMARVPLYWIAEAGFTPQPLQAVQATSPAISFSRWLLNHVREISEQLKR